MLNNDITKKASRGSWIRKMYELGEKYKAEGLQNVYDFSIGNPTIKVNDRIYESCLTHLNDSDIHYYMPNSGHIEVCQKISNYYNEKFGLYLERKHVIMTSGASGAINIALKTILNPGEEVIVISPYFLEYPYYIENFGGVVKVVNSNEEFQLDIEAIKQAVNNQTKAIIINNPNNPTGVIYSNDSLIELSTYLNQKDIFVILDEVYQKIIYDNIKIEASLKLFNNALYINSFSKSLNIPGQRIGYLIVSPLIKDCDILIRNAIFINRSLGFGNANSLFQRVVGDCLAVELDLSTYIENRSLLLEYLNKNNVKYIKPSGAFYLFIKVSKPYESDISFSDALARVGVLVVPGTAFNAPGYVRLSYCVATAVIKAMIASEPLERIL